MFKYLEDADEFRLNDPIYSPNIPQMEDVRINLKEIEWGRLGKIEIDFSLWIRNHFFVQEYPILDSLHKALFTNNWVQNVGSSTVGSKTHC